MALILNHSDCLLEAGCDEAGRGCLAGPVVAAAVILPPDFYHPLLNDSKQVSTKDRNILRPFIEEHVLTWAIAICSPQEIDNINILQASILAMHRALDQLNKVPDFVLVDGNRFNKYKTIPHATMVKGDARFTSIAAASILAKTHRDEIMLNLHNEFPHYGWDRNMGYPTIAHRKGIEQFGPCEWHRKSFRLLKEQLDLFG